MSKPRILIPVVLSLILSPLVLAAHATTPTYLAGVTSGQWATYAPVKAIYTSSIYGTEPQMVTDLNNTLTTKVTVETVSSPARNVTLQQANTFDNATGSRSDTLTIDLQTGNGNATYFLIPAGLSANDPIYNSPTMFFKPTISATTVMTYLGNSLLVNVYNRTSSSFSGIGYYNLSSTESLVSIWDWSSGILLEFKYSLASFTSYLGHSYGTYENIDLVITDTNVYTPRKDFTIRVNPTGANILAGQTATIGITVLAETGFTGTVSLSVSITPSRGLTCSLSSDSVTLTNSTGTATSSLSCSGIYSGYSVIITGTSGTLSYSTPPVTVTVQDFTVVQSSTFITTNSAVTATAIIAVSPQDGFSGTVELTQSVDKSGLTWRLFPTALPIGASTTLSCSGAPGAYTVTVTCTSQGLTHTIAFIVDVNSQNRAGPAFTIPGSIPSIFYAIIAAIIWAIAAASWVVTLRSRKKPTGTDLTSKMT